MARPRKAVRPIEKNISIPEDLVCKVDLRLFSELEGRVPHGAWSRYISGLIRADLSEGEQLRAELQEMQQEIHRLKFPLD
jgi:hypothetical protein